MASSSGWSRVLGLDAVGGPPYCDFANQGGGMSFRCSPGGRVVTLPDVILNLGGEVGDKAGSLRQVVAPDGIGVEPWWNARQPGQRTRVGGRERGEAPVEDGRRIACGSNIASAGSCQQVAKRVFTSFGRKGDQMSSEGGPGGFTGESGDVLVGLVELCDGLGSEELFGCHVQPVGVALDRLEKAGPLDR